MVLLVPKALAKQIMCINTRRMEEGRGVSGKNEAPKGGNDQNHLCWSRQWGKDDAHSGKKEKPFFFSRNKNWKWKGASCSSSFLICISGL